jgi:Fe2+ or Zn2+ uptake regulation protein
MLYIKKNDGKTTSTAICDKCGNGLTWENNTSISRMEHVLRNKHGWNVGKAHICEKCKGAR